MNKVYFNINNYVYVKLTSRGKMEYLKYLNSPLLYLAQEPKYNSFEETNLKPNKDGCYKFQLWNLMHIFGEHMGVGFSNCFETDIYFNKKDLKEQS